MYNRVAIITDNNIFSQKDFNEALKIIHGSSIQGISVFVPEVVLREYLAPQYSVFDKDIKNLNRLQKKYKDDGLKIEGIHHLKNSVGKQFSILFDKYEHNIIKIPKNHSKLFDDIFKASLKKTPPFKSGKHSSDKGFKDRVILLSIIDFAKKSGMFERYILLTNDEELKKTKQEFEKKTGATIQFENTNLTQVVGKESNDTHYQKIFLFLDKTLYPKLEKSFKTQKTISVKEFSYIGDDIFDNNISVNFSQILKNKTGIYKNGEKNFSVVVIIELESNDALCGNEYFAEHGYKYIQKNKFICDWCTSEDCPMRYFGNILQFNVYSVNTSSEELEYSLENIVYYPEIDDDHMFSGLLY